MFGASNIESRSPSDHAVLFPSPLIRANRCFRSLPPQANSLQLKHKIFSTVIPLLKSSLHLGLVAVATCVLSFADTTFDNTKKFVWDANTGWISFRHDRPTSPDGVTFGGAFLSGYAWSATTKTITDPGNPRKFFRATTIVPRTL